MTSKYKCLSEISKDFLEEKIDYHSVIIESYRIGQSSRNTEVSNLQVEIKELAEVLRMARAYVGNADTKTLTEERQVNELLCKINDIIFKHKKTNL